MKLIETQREQAFDCDGDKVLVTTRQPSERHGAWPGNAVTIRNWLVFKKGTAGIYVHCTDDDIRMYEAALGEWPNIRIINHPTLGRVSAPIA